MTKVIKDSHKRNIYKANELNKKISELYNEINNLLEPIQNEIFEDPNMSLDLLEEYIRSFPDGLERAELRSYYKKMKDK